MVAVVEVADVDEVRDGCDASPVTGCGGAGGVEAGGDPRETVCPAPDVADGSAEVGTTIRNRGGVGLV